MDVKLSKIILAVIKDESGAEALEYALVAGLVTVAAVGVIGRFGTKALARWTTVNSSM